MSFPAPAYGQQPQQGFGGPPQQPQAPQPFTQTVDEFWQQNSGGGGGAPSYDFTPQAPMVKGTIVDMKARQRTEMGTGALKFDKNGKPQMQLEVTLDTELRGWQGVKNIPTDTNPQTGQETPRPAEADDGKRRIYVWYTLRDAVTAAMAEAGVTQPKQGDMLAVQVVGTQPNQKGGTPIKVYKAWIQPGSPDAQAFFGQQAAPAPAAPQAYQQPQQAPAPQFQQAAPAPVAPQQAPAPAPQQDPWGQQATPAPTPGWGGAASQDPPF